MDLTVKFDLQLYKLDNNSYLVDFKNIGTSSSGKSSSPRQPPEDPSIILQRDMLRTAETLNELRLEGVDSGERQARILNWKAGGNKDDHYEVSSVYPFLDVCSKLITDIV